MGRLDFRKYHLILIGSENEEVEHQDFGPLHTDGKGELQIYKTFGGPALEAYDFCLLCTDTGDGEMEIIYKGILFEEGKRFWEDLCSQSEEVAAFTIDCDETGARWYRAKDFDHLPVWAKRCVPWMEKYGHYIIGRNDDTWFLGVPGRFLKKEQPVREEGIFLLWQPMRGGEAFFDRPDKMTAKQQEDIFGYWIAEIDTERGRLQAV